MVRRYNALVEKCWSNGWNISIVASTRDYATQKGLYDAWRAGLRSAQAANPDVDLYTSPWGWVAKGSLHQIQADGFSHALDLGWSGCSPMDLANAAAEFGLRLDVAGENWHFQWWDYNGIHDAPALKDDDMTLEEFAKGIGAEIENGVVVVPLIDDDLQNFKKYPLAAALTYTHEEMKIARLKK